MQQRLRSFIVLAGLALSLGVLSLDAFGVTVPVNINTTSLSGRSGTLAFDFIDGGDGPNNSVQISGFGSPVTLTDTSGFDEFLHSVLFGASLPFTLDVTTNFNSALSPVPDALSLFFLNTSALSSIVTSTDPTGADAIMRVDLVGGTAGENTVFFQFTPRPIPEPSTLLLLSSGLPLIAWRLRGAGERM